MRSLLVRLGPRDNRRPLHGQLRRLLVALASAASLGGCATALVMNDDALSKEAPATTEAPASPRSSSDFGSSAPHWFGSGGP